MASAFHPRFLQPLRFRTASSLQLTLALALAVALALLGSASAAEVALRVAEETPRRASVGNLFESLGGGSGGSGSAFRIVPRSPYFAVDEAGNVRVDSRIDREDSSACPNAGETTPCVMEFNAFRGANRVLVRVTIEDINDNSPVFKDAQKVLFVEEGDTKFRHPLDLATDADIGDNGIATKGRYFLREDGAGMFTLDQSQRGFLSLALNGAPTIDYEQERQYNLTLVACDGGREERCGQQALTVQVKDRNDNSPNVTGIQVSDVPESLAVGGLVAVITAHDRDSGLNGQLEFAVSDPGLAQVFDIDREGRVTLKRALNARMRASYEVPVLVSDAGSPRRRTATRFSFRVIDTNDHAPSLQVLPMTETGDRIVVSENIQSALLALVMVTDEDLGDNARVECQLAGEADRRSFRLDGNSNGGYTLVLTAAFNFEETPSETVRVSCRDFGQPPRNSSQRVTVYFRNENEFQPQFTLGNYYTSMEETFGASGNNIGRTVLTLLGSDGDRGEELTFSLDPEAKHADLFDLQTEATLFDEGLGATVGRGHLRVRSTIDRDSLDVPGDLLRLGIILRDSKDNNGTRRSASATVTVSVIDLNDNAPQVQPPLLFQLRENSAPGTRALSHPIGAARLTHRDPDQGINADAFYRLLAVVGKPPRGDDLGGVGTDSGDFGERAPVVFSEPDRWPLNLTEDGVIISSRQLDRETFESFTLTVMAYNRAAKNPLNSTALITVELLDENDNDPEWVFPSEKDFVINYTTTSRAALSTTQWGFEEVTRVEARDRDRMSNVTYALVGGSVLFSVDRLSGRLRPQRELPPGRHELSVRADDNGPGLNRVAYARLVVNVARRAGRAELRDAQANLAIIVAMVIATAVISVVLVFAIVCVRRRGRGDFVAASGPGGGGGVGVGGGSSGLGCGDKEACQCSEADIRAMEPHHYGRLCSGAQRPQFALTTFSHGGSACDLRPPLVMELRNEVIINQQDLDGDSADSGRGGSEDDHAGHLFGAVSRPGHHLQPSAMNGAGGSVGGVGGGGGGTLPRRLVSPTLPHGSNVGAGMQHQMMQHQHLLPLPQMMMKQPARHHQYLGIPEEDFQSTGSGEAVGFLPPPLPPHGIELRGSPGPAFHHQHQHQHQYQHQHQPQYQQQSQYQHQPQHTLQHQLQARGGIVVGGYSTLPVRQPQSPQPQPVSLPQPSASPRFGGGGGGGGDGGSCGGSGDGSQQLC